KVGRSLGARFKRVAPALVGQLHLLDRHPRVGGHADSSGCGTTVIRSSAIRLGAAIRTGSASPSNGVGASWRPYAGEASAISARSTSERRTRHSRPARTAARRSVLIHLRSVAGWSFSSSLTCWTVSHGSRSEADVAVLGAGIRTLA